MPGFISNYIRLPDIVIPAGQTYSQIINSANIYSDAAALYIQSPATLPETVKIYVHASPAVNSTSDANWVPLESYLSGALADVTVPSAGKGRVYSELVACGSFMLVASTAVAATRTFLYGKYYTI